MEILKMCMIICWCASSTAEAGFAEDAAFLLRRVRLPRGTLRHVAAVVRDLHATLQAHWPDTEVTPFGSIMAGLGIVGSDIDCYAKLPEPYQETIVFEAKNILEQYQHLFHHPEAVIDAKMPHVRLIHAPTGLRCDVSFKNRAGVRNTALLKYYMTLDDTILDLTTIVRYWAKLHKPIYQRRIMSNFSMVTLVIFYLQQLRLPPVVELQRNADEDIVDNWNTGFNELNYSSSNSLLDLLGGFFQYYSQFDFENKIVSIFTGVPLNRSDFHDVAKVPDLFDLYKRNVAMNVTLPLNISSPVLIQDPFIHNLNLISESTKEVLAKFRSDLRFAAKAYEEAKSDFLKVILEGNRQNLKETWTNSTEVNSCAFSADSLCYTSGIPRFHLPPGDK